MFAKDGLLVFFQILVVPFIVAVVETDCLTMFAKDVLSFNPAAVPTIIAVDEDSDMKDMNF